MFSAYLLNYIGMEEWELELSPFEQKLQDLRSLHESKRQQYTGGVKDRLANYRFSAEAVGDTVEEGMFARMSEKYFRLRCYFTGAEQWPEHEPLANDLMDISNISLLILLAMEKAEGYA